jgi:predicted Zn-dependent peptidase
MNYIKTNKLTNGIFVGTDNMPQVETVAISILVKTGSRYETVANNGISHFLEHMAFKGTERRSAKDIAEEFDQIGGYLNAYTSREKTVYHAKVLKDDVEIATDILTDILQNSVFSDEEIERERGVILQEIAQTKDTPDDIIFDYFQETAFANQAIGRSILGTEELVQRFTREDFLNYVNNHYSYDNIIISAAGNIDHNHFSRLLENKCTKFAPKANKFKDKSSYTGGELRIYKDLEQVHLVLGFNGCSYLQPEYYTQQILSLIIGGGMSSRLFQEVREKRGLAYGISAFTSNYEDCGIFGIYSSTTEDKVNELLEVTIQELHKAAQKITEDELQRAKAQVKASLLMAQESSISRAEKLAGNYAAFGRYLSIEEILKNIELIDTKQVTDLMNNLLKNNFRPTLVSIGKIDTLYSYGEVQTKLAA